MFAGPNGSGKSTLQNVIEPSLLGYYFNSDEIELALKSDVGYDLSGLPFELTIPEILDSLREFPSAPLEIRAGQIVIRDRHIFVNGGEGMSYLAASLSELMRRRLLEFGESFSFETVMSHPSKVELLKVAQARGFRTYLYFIATDDPQINVSRVRSRVQSGGHAVPEQKIVDRYYRSLELLSQAIRYSDRAYIFDNSIKNDERVFVAEFESSNNVTLQIEEHRVPKWFVTYVSDKLK